MYNIRQGLFETNSSSADVFCIPKNPSLKIPKEIKMSRLMTHTYSLEETASMEDKLAFMYNKAEDEGNAADFLQYLTNKGINVINDVGNTFEFDSYMFGYYMEQKSLDAFLFDPNSMYLHTLEDEEYKKDFIVLKCRR